MEETGKRMRSPIENLPGRPSPPPPLLLMWISTCNSISIRGDSPTDLITGSAGRGLNGEEEVITTRSILQCHFKLLFLLLVWGLAIKVTTAWSPVTLSVMKPLTIHTASTCHYSTACSHFNILGAVPSYRQRTKTGLSVKDTQGQN